MVEIVKMTVESLTPLMQEIIKDAARGAAFDDKTEQLKLMGFAMLVWPKLLEAGGEAAAMELAESDRRMAETDGDKTPYRKEPGYKDKPDQAFVDYSIKVGDHHSQIRIADDEALRDRIFELLVRDHFEKGA